MMTSQEMQEVAAVSVTTMPGAIKQLSEKTNLSQPIAFGILCASNMVARASQLECLLMHIASSLQRIANALEKVPAEESSTH